MEMRPTTFGRQRQVSSRAALRPPEDMHRTLKQEGEFHYLDAGGGQPIVLLHGLFGALSNFQPLFEHFTPKYRVLVPMQPLYTLPMLKTKVPAPCLVRPPAPAIPLPPLNV